MKSSVLIVLFACVACAGLAQTNNESVLAKYESNETAVVSRQGQLAVVFQPTPQGRQVVLAKEFDSSKPIYVKFASMTNRSSLLFMLKPEYAFRFSAVSENGEVIEPTHKGAQYGRRFDDLKGFDHDAIAMNNRGTPMRDVAGQIDSWIPIGTPMLVPDELFKFKKPGKYTVTIEAACFASRNFPPSGPLEKSYFLAKFPAVKLTVVKKEEQK